MIQASAYTLLKQEQKQRNKCCFYTLQCSHTHTHTSSHPDHGKTRALFLARTALFPDERPQSACRWRMLIIATSCQNWRSSWENEQGSDLADVVKGEIGGAGGITQTYQSVVEYESGRR